MRATGDSSTRRPGAWALWAAAATFAALATPVAVAAPAAEPPATVTAAASAPPQLPQFSLDAQAEALARYFFHPRLVFANAERIGLTREQRERIEQLVHASQREYRQQRFELANAMTLIAALAVEQPVDEDKILDQLDRILEIERRIKRSQLLMLVRVKNVLTSEQLVLLDEIRRRQIEARRSRQQRQR